MMRWAKNQTPSSVRNYSHVTAFLGGSPVLRVRSTCCNIRRCATGSASVIRAIRRQFASVDYNASRLNVSDTSRRAS